MDGALLPVLSTLLLNNNSRWNILLIFLVNFVVINYKQVEKYAKKLKLFGSPKHAQFSMKAKLTYKNNSIWHIGYPLNFLAVNRHIINHLLESNKHEYEIHEYPSLSSNDDIMFFYFEKPCEIAPNITIKTGVEKTISSSAKGSDYEYIDLEILIKTSSNNFNVIKSFVDKCVKEYNEERMDSMKEQHIFVFSSLDSDTEVPLYTEYPFTTTKCFSNCFFDEKDKVLRMVNNFVENKAEYVRLGLPYTLGILLHGVAGSGKTSFIKSLAKHTGRHVIIIPTGKVKNVDTLKSIFLKIQINYVKIPNHKRLYVFEDADCSSWKNILLKRSDMPEYFSEPIEKDTVLLEVINKMSTDEESTSKKKPKEDKMTLTLSDILELLDGIIEIDGRMVVMTTNHIDAMDPALTRPGRFDLCLEFKEMTCENICTLFELWFPGKSIPKEVYDKIQDRRFTQAQVGSIFSSRDFAEIYKALIL